MAFKDQFTWEQGVSSIGKHCTAMGLLLCPACERLPPRPAHGVDAAPVAAPPRSPPKTPQNYTGKQNATTSMPPSSTSGRLIVSLLIKPNVFREMSKRVLNNWVYILFSFCRL
jgi:hypothetical protein